MSVLKIENLTKKYPSFTLDGVSFEVENSRIVGFIGRNGAGKTTTIKSMLNLVHPDGGKIEFFGLDMLENECEIKSRIGYSTGSVNYYPKKKIKDIISVTRLFYPNWDEGLYRYYSELFGIDENKMPSELSEGMKVKCNLLPALSHKAEILILDEPTSGLDPFSRDELLELFAELKKRGVAIFFSTHITSDLEKSADDIVYISRGKIIAAMPKDKFMTEYSADGETLEKTVLRIERENKR